jgi:hypothetical protein
VVYVKSQVDNLSSSVNPGLARGIRNNVSSFVVIPHIPLLTRAVAAAAAAAAAAATAAARAEQALNVGVEQHAQQQCVSLRCCTTSEVHVCEQRGRKLFSVQTEEAHVQQRRFNHHPMIAHAIDSFKPQIGKNIPFARCPGNVRIVLLFSALTFLPRYRSGLTI